MLKEDRFATGARRAPCFRLQATSSSGGGLLGKCSPKRAADSELACAIPMTAAAANAAAATPTRYERTLHNCARDLSNFAACTGAVFDEDSCRGWAREQRSEATMQAGLLVVLKAQIAVVVFITPRLAPCVTSGPPGPSLPPHRTFAPCRELRATAVPNSG